MRILVTNDDGIDSIGLHVLARAVARHGDITVAAPDGEYSGASAALGALHLLEPTVSRRRIELLDGVDGVEAIWAVDGPPALCTYFARLGAFGPPPDLVVSGINPGANVGRAVYHSGTVGAALTARNGGISSIAVSQQVEYGAEGQSWEAAIADQRWEAAADVAELVVAAMVEHPTAEPIVINLNVPNCPVEEMSGWRVTRVGTDLARSMSSVELTPVAETPDTFTVAMSYGERMELPIDTDGGTVADRTVAVTWLGRMDHDPTHDQGPISAALTTRLAHNDLAAVGGRADHLGDIVAQPRSASTA